MKKIGITTRNTGRYTELRFEWRGWQGKLATSMCLQNPNWHLSSGRGVSGVSPEVQKVLQFLHLCQIFNGIFVKFNKASVNTLRFVEPYIAWGYPNMTLANEWTYKHSSGKVNKK